MKQLTCEMCGGTDLIKQDGVFVCQNCGMKYSVEEAKKMMIEGTVDVQGTVKVDNSSFVEKYLVNARRALEKEDWDEVEKYYNLVEQNDPSNIEAIFYSAYGKAKASLTVNDIYKREAIFKALCNSVSILDDNYDVNKSAACNEVMDRIVTDVIRMYGSSFVYTQTTNGYGVKTDNRSATYSLFINLGSELYNTLRNIAEKIPESSTAERIAARKLQLRMVDFLTTPASHLSGEARTKNAQVAMAVAQKIKELDPSFVSKDYARIIQFAQESAKKEERSNILKGVMVVAIIVIGVIIGVVVGLS